MRLKPNINNLKLTRRIKGFDQDLNVTEIDVIEEKPLTLYLNSQEIVTMMTINDYPEYLAVGYLLNQNMLLKSDKILSIDYEHDISTVVVRTKRITNFEKKLKKKTLTSGCAQGTVFGDMMENFENIKLDLSKKIKIEWIYQLSKKINLTPSLYLKAGAIHGCVLCKDDNPLIYMEDVGRHNAIDKIAGYMFINKIDANDKIFYTTGRLTSEMVLKSVQMQIPIVISRSGFTAWGVELANKANLTLVGRARGKKFIVLSGKSRFEKI
tara:strand:- start:468 stop:1268 length:801 start_codon:yes stop_codon:yes gene_type:complete